MVLQKLAHCLIRESYFQRDLIDLYQTLSGFDNRIRFREKLLFKLKFFRVISHRERFAKLLDRQKPCSIILPEAGDPVKIASLASAFLCVLLQHVLLLSLIRLRLPAY
jgi:hypothetical protein